MNEALECDPNSDFFGYSSAFLDELEILPARVKWFDEVKGFGFVNTFGCPDDVFIHVDVLRASGLGIVETGSAIAVKVTQGERGLLAIRAYTWNVAIED
jgi:CspA family cold shock protein